MIGTTFKIRSLSSNSQTRTRFNIYTHFCDIYIWFIPDNIYQAIISIHSIIGYQQSQWLNDKKVSLKKNVSNKFFSLNIKKILWFI